MTIEENGVRYRVQFEGSHKTGFFCDQRDNRKQLTGFTRVLLEPAEAADIQFRVHADRTAFTGRDLTRIVEPGEVEVLVGTSAADLPFGGTVRLTGPIREVGHDRRQTTPVDLRPAKNNVEV